MLTMTDCKRLSEVFFSLSGLKEAHPSAASIRSICSLSQQFGAPFPPGLLLPIANPWHGQDSQENMNCVCPIPVRAACRKLQTTKPLSQQVPSRSGHGWILNQCRWLKDKQRFPSPVTTHHAINSKTDTGREMHSRITGAIT